MCTLTFQLLQVLLFRAIIVLGNDDCNVRYRKSWYSLTPQEQEVYMTGFRTIRANGALAVITGSDTSTDASLFFSIHEHLVYEAENAIRSLGGDYACFGMPYWDFSVDSSMEDDAAIFNCLSTTRTLPSSIEIAFAIQSNADFEAFSRCIRRFVDYVHAFVGTQEECRTSEDPILFLLSSFLGYIGGLWTDCNGFDFDVSVLGIQYELGSFWSTLRCNGHLNNERFVIDKTVNDDVWKERYGYGGDDISGILSDESSETQYINPSNTKDFKAFDTSLWSVIVWCSMFIFIFMMCCYMFTVKKDFETEIIYKKHRK
eukprot:392018_1